MTHGRTVGVWLLSALAVAALVAWWMATFERVQRSVDLPPRGEAAYNPLYALKLALRADGQRVESRQRLQLDSLQLGRRDTVLVYSDPRTLASSELDALFAFAEQGGHLVLRLPSWDYRAGALGLGNLEGRLPLQPPLAEPRCASLFVHGEKPHVEFCRGARFRLAQGAQPLAAWRVVGDQNVFARFAHGDGSIDLLSDLDFVAGKALRDPPHRVLARQILAPRYGEGTIHLVYAADMPPLWRWLLDHGWMALLPLLLALLAWLWMRMQRFGPLLPSPLQPRRSLLEHVQASGEHLVRYGHLALLHRATRDAVLARLRRRDPLAAALDGEAQAATLAARTGLPAVELRATLDTRPPAVASEFRTRIARLIALRKRL
jgi:hypothetical protein